MVAEEIKINLDREVTKEEIEEAIISTKVGKSPSPDGYTSLYFKNI